MSIQQNYIPIILHYYQKVSAEVVGRNANYKSVNRRATFLDFISVYRMYTCCQAKKLTSSLECVDAHKWWRRKRQWLNSLGTRQVCSC